MPIQELILFSMAATWTPGPNPLMAMSNAQKVGFKRNLRFLGGIYPAFIMVMLLSIRFSKTLTSLSPRFDLSLRILGAIYIVTLGLKILKPKKIKVEEREGLGFKEGFWLQFLNLKVMAYGLTASSRWVIPHSHSLGTDFGYALLLASIPMVANLLWSAFGALLSRWYDRHMKLFNTIFALLLFYSAYKILK